jgi:nitric oxide reductase NorD protein
MPGLEQRLQAYRARLGCNFAQIEPVFADCLREAEARLSEQGMADYLDGASLVCMIGRGVEPVLIYLQEMPRIADRLGEEALELVSRSVWRLSRTPNGASIPAFMQSIVGVTARLGSYALFEHYIDLLMGFARRTSSSIHGNQSATIPSPSLPHLLERMPLLLGELSLAGLKNWIDYGVQHYLNHPERQQDYFSLQSADSRAVFQRERSGTLFADQERRLELYFRALWLDADQLIPYSLAFDRLRKPMPYYDSLGIRLPDVYEDRAGVSGLDRYRALLAHIGAHRRWSSSIIADNYSPFQRVAIETFEDCRVEYLALKQYPGMRPLWLALHPKPAEDACDPEQTSCIRHRLAMFSYAVLDSTHGYRDPDLLDFVSRFFALMAEPAHSTQDVAALAIAYIARTRRQSDLSANVFFTDTEVDYRDDNRHLWRYIESGDEEESFEEPRRQVADEEEPDRLPPRHYPEWDYQSRLYRPDWVSLYESLHPAGDAAHIDRLLARHAGLAKRLKQMLDLLKPQQYVRQRYREDGSELDLDVAIRALIDLRAGSQPDPRINMSHRTDGRDIAVTLLIDLSESINLTPEGCAQSILELSQTAVALLGWAIETLGDEFAIGGFSSNTRHEVRYQHIKGFSEHWNQDVKARLAAMQAGWSTRMGAAMRHAGHALSRRQAEKKLLLILTDGEPSDIDETDPKRLIEDARKAVQELDADGIYSYCINLDPFADDYVGDIFGNRYAVIDCVERLPERLPQLFMALTR